jgi:HK97 family phage prohead protease
MPDIITRTFEVADFDVKRSRQGRTVTAYAAVFDQPAEIRDAHGHYWEDLHRSSFNRTLAHGIGKVGVFYNHGYDLSGKPNGLLAVPFATPEEIRPDGKGLLTVSRYNDGEVADAVLAAWEGGQITGQSFRGPVYQSRQKGKREGIPYVQRTELGLKEYGPTHSPAYEGAGLVAIRSQEDLAELIRSMISKAVPPGTPTASPGDDSDTPASGPVAAGDSPMGHSSRIKARQLLLRARALDMGVVRGKAAQDNGHRG